VAEQELHNIMLIGFWKKRLMYFFGFILISVVCDDRCMVHVVGILSMDDRQKFTVEFLHERTSFHFYPLQKT
jgi:hypothetical protein